MTTYYVPTTTNTVDGDTFCGGACTAADTIIIRGGARGNLLLKDFNGSGSYIPIINENGTSKVEITNDSSVGFGILNLSNCKYVDLRGNNDSGIGYGIKTVNDGTPSSRAGSVWVYGEGDHIKLSYIEMAFDGNTSPTTGDGVNVKDPNLDETSIFDTIEIHNNYIHGCRYAGMYLGMNNPPIEHNPYIANFSVHDNLLEDCGAYGITMKGVHSGSGTNSIYNNIIRGSAGGQSTGLVTSYDGEFMFGIGGSRFYGSTYMNIYNNWVEKTMGSGIQIGDQNHNIYNNTVVGCGAGNEEHFGHGIMTHASADGINIYDNIIIQPKRYGIFARGSTELLGATMSRNLIGDAGLGEWDELQPGRLVESTGDDANWYEADVADFGFTAWSDDNDYSNDIFTFGGIPYTRSRGILRRKPTYNNVGGRFR